MYRTPVIIGKIMTGQGEPDNDAERRGLIFDNDRRSIHYPTYTRLLAKTKKIIIYLSPAFIVLISREIVRQRR